MITKTKDEEVKKLKDEIIRLKEIDMTMAQKAKLRKLSENEVSKKVNIARHCLSLICSINSTSDEIIKETNLLAMTGYLKLVKKEIIEE